MEDPAKYFDSKRRYYQLRNWSEDGAPNEETLTALDLPPLR
jgi:aldehyde:ferredoxin oxidoreductase